MDNSLCIAIPTFNRPRQLRSLLNSIYSSSILLSDVEKRNISICIYNNSSLFYEEYEQIVEFFYNKFSNSINKFSHFITGVNVGSANNCFAAIINSDSKYTWFMPDDDFLAKDSLKIFFEITHNYEPCMIHGGWKHKSTVDYNFSYEHNEFETLANSIHRVVEIDKISTFFDKSVVEAQEHIYRTENIKAILKNPELKKLINEMCPGVFAVYSLLGLGPLVTLERSLGVWRSGDRSSWRNRWHKLQLETWPNCVNLMYKYSLISLLERDKGLKIYRDVFDWMGHRPDVFLGINLKYQLNPFVLIAHHKCHYIKNLIKSPYKILLKCHEKLK
jgi:hypothetical protein